MTNPEDSRRMTHAMERVTGTWYCRSGKHEVSKSIASVTHRGLRTCANCAARIHQHRKKDSHE